MLAGAASIAGMTLTLQNRIAAIKAVGSVVGTLASTVFLLAIAMVNLIVLRSTYRAFVKVRSGLCYQDQTLTRSWVTEAVFQEYFVRSFE